MTYPPDWQTIVLADLDNIIARLTAVLAALTPPDRQVSILTEDTNYRQLAHLRFPPMTGHLD
ncbi:MAG: hypothetical protein IIC71_12580 [Acidobacteria bacterium]|nr:hypothetical protein [Acidobacteriota bacterium]